MDYKMIIGIMHRYDVLRKLCIRKETSELDMHRGQFPMLREIIKNDGCTQNELAEALHVTPASIACSAKRMQHSGLIEKSPDENDLRCNRITITERGRRAAELFKTALDAIDKRTFSGFSEEELSSLYDMLTRMGRNVAGDNADKTIAELAAELCELEGDNKC